MRIFKIGDPTFLAAIEAVPPPDEVNLVQEDDSLLLTEAGGSLLCE